MDFFKLTEVFCDLALQAGDAIMEIYSRGNIVIETKTDSSPVTNADKAADAIIYRGLKAAFPNLDVVTEEKSESHYLLKKNFILVDPLDGTKEFINRTGEFTVNIAYIQNNSPSHGVVYAPAIKRLFTTDHSSKSYEIIRPATKTGKMLKNQLQVSVPDPSALTVIASKSHINLKTKKYLEKYSISNSKNAGSSLKFCLIAAGEADLYPRLGRTMEWDTAAGHAILLGAGGHVTNLSTKKPLYYGKAGFENPFFVAHSQKSIIKN